MFSTLIKQQNLFPILAFVIALGYLAAVTIPLINHSRSNSGRVNLLANTAFVSLTAEIAQQKQQDFMQISEWHLFGLPHSQLSSNGKPLETQLELKLQGVFFLAQHQKMAHAIIESTDQIQKTYKVNDELPGGAILQAIENDKIILLRDNKQEYLELDRKKLESAPATELNQELEPEPEAELETEPEPAAE